MEKYTKYPTNFVNIVNRPFIHHLDYGLSRGFIVSPVEDFPYTCSPHNQEIRIVKSFSPTNNIIGLVPGSLEQPITMPGLDYGPVLKTPVTF